MRWGLVIAWWLSTGLMLGGCAASDKMAASMESTMHGVAEKLPEWAGGPAKGLPPRPTDPGYADYKKQLEGKAAPAPATQPANDSADHQATGK